MSNLRQFSRHTFVAILLTLQGTLTFASQTVGISVDTSGNYSNLESQYLSMSFDGRLVAFETEATNFDSTDTNDASDIYLKDLNDSSLIRISKTSTGQAPNGYSQYPTINSDGSAIGYASSATDISPSSATGIGIYLYNRLTDLTVLASVSSSGSPANGSSGFPSIDGSGQLITFWSWASNLSSEDTNGTGADVFLRDIETGTTTLISKSTGSIVLSSSATSAYLRSSISSNGRFVAFEYLDTNGIWQIYGKNLKSGELEVISVDPQGANGNGNSKQPAISADGRFVAFQSWANDLVSNDTNGAPDIFVRDRISGETTRVSIAPDGSEAIGEWALDLANTNGKVSISENGRFVSFWTMATNLKSGDTPYTADVFVHDTVNETTSYVSPGLYHSLKGYGRYISVYSNNLLSQDTTTPWDIYWIDRSDESSHCSF